MEFQAVAAGEGDVEQDGIVQVSLPQRQSRSRSFYRFLSLATVLLVSQAAVAATVFQLMDAYKNRTITYPPHVPSQSSSRFVILFGRKEGYGAVAKTHNLTQVQDIIDSWMLQRLAANQHVFSGALRTETLLYPHGRSAKTINREEAAVFAGVVREDGVDTQAVLDTLLNMTAAVCTPLEQVVCFYEYKNVEYVWTNPELN